MNTKLRFLLLLVFLTTLQVAHAGPVETFQAFVIAGKIQERPEMFDLSTIGEMAEAIIQGAEDIEEISVEVGDPAMALNVLIVKPKDYGFNVVGTIQKDKKGVETANFAIKNSSQKLGQKDFERVLSPERRKELKEKGHDSFEFNTEEVIEVVKLTAREGGTEVEEKSKTIFLLSGYGVPNRGALPWALILAKHGYQVIVPDLRGFGKSGGKGPTWGKREVEDLMELLTHLQSTEKIGATEAVGVMGVSYGAAMASLWTARDPRVEASVLIAPYAQADETILSAAEIFKDQFNLPFDISPESVRKGTDLAATMLEVTWEDVAPAKAIPTIQHPILFITSPRDKIIPSSVVTKLHQSAKEGSTLRSINVPHVILGFYLEELEPDVLAYFNSTLRSPDPAKD